MRFPASRPLIVATFLASACMPLQAAPKTAPTNGAPVPPVLADATLSVYLKRWLEVSDVPGAQPHRLYFKGRAFTGVQPENLGDFPSLDSCTAAIRGVHVEGSTQNGWARTHYECVKLF